MTSQQIGILLERTENIQSDVAEIKDMLRAKESRLKQLELDVHGLQVARRVSLSLAATVGGVVATLVNWVLTFWTGGSQ